MNELRIKTHVFFFCLNKKRCGTDVYIDIGNSHEDTNLLGKFSNNFNRGYKHHLNINFSGNYFNKGVGFSGKEYTIY